MIVLKILAVLGLLFLVYILFLFVCSLFVNPKKEYENNSRFYRHLLYSASIAALKLLRVKVHTSGLEQIPPDTKLLFVGNHRSNFDPIIQWIVLKKWDVAFISKESNFKIPFFGRFIRKCCFMAIDRENPRNALTTISKAIKLLQREEVSVGVYPEGTRSKTKELLSFHNGVFRIAQKADKPIVVMAISGTEQIHKNFLRHSTNVYLEIVDVIPAKETKTMRTDEIGNRVRISLENRLTDRDT